MEPAYIYRATCHRVVDGDTFEADVDLGFYVTLRVKVRLHNVDTPERGEVGWREASAALREFITEKPLILQSYKDQRTFERWVCDVWVDDENVSEHMKAWQ